MTKKKIVEFIGELEREAHIFLTKRISEATQDQSDQITIMVAVSTKLFHRTRARFLALLPELKSVFQTLSSKEALGADASADALAEVMKGNLGKDRKI